MNMMKLFFVAAMVALIVCPVMGGISNISVNDSSFVSHTYKHDENYMRFEYEVLIIGIGIACLVLSRAIEAAEDILSVAAVVPLATSTWFANFTTFESVEVIGSQVVYAQVVAPNAFLSIAMLVLTIGSIINVIWIFVLKPADDKTDTEQDN